MIGEQIVLLKFYNKVRNDKFDREIGLALCSMWACQVLISNPKAGTLAADIAQSGVWWAWFVGVAALMKIAGLIMYQINYVKPYSMYVRFLGLGMSGAWWTILGAKTIWNIPDSIFAFGGILWGMFAFLAIARLSMETN